MSYFWVKIGHSYPFWLDSFGIIFGQFWNYYIWTNLKFNVESAFLTFEPKQQRDHFEAAPIECPDEYQSIDAAMDACRAAVNGSVNANCSTQSSTSCDKNWDCGAKRDSETIDSEYELNPCPNGKPNS